MGRNRHDRVVLRRALRLCLPVLLYSATLATMTCSSSKPKPPAEAVSAAVIDESAVTPSGAPPFHPKEATAWATQVLLLAHRQPDPKLVSNCFDQAEALVADAGNEEALLAAKQLLIDNVRREQTVFHWCFYQMMHELDQNLRRHEIDFRGLGASFLEGMKKLWLLAEALDETTEHQQYFEYLRERYIQISKDVFGRSVGVIGSPLNGRMGPPRLPDPDKAKPAQESDIE